jgi:hypothetical protein
VDIVLNTGTKGVNLRFDPERVQGWTDNKKGQKYVRFTTGLSSPFTQIFLKYWINNHSPAHKLLIDCCGQPMQGTPRVLGVGQEKTAVIYAFEALSGHYKRLDRLLEEPDAEKWLTPQLMLRVIKQSEACFRTLERCRHVYTDLSVKNIMLDPARDDLLLIDVDSAWSFTELKKRNGIGDHFQFDIHYWCLWSEYVLRHHKYSCPSPALLPKTMVLTLGAIWGRALALLQNNQSSANEALKLVQSPIPDEQRPLWEALLTRDKAEFEKYFQLSTQVDELYECWQEVFSGLIEDPHVPWDDVRQAANLIAQANIKAHGKKAQNRIAKPSNPLAPIPFI